MKIELKDIIIICLFLALVYLHFDKLKKIYKNIKKKYFSPKELEIQSDLTNMKKEQEIIQLAIKENINTFVKDKKLREIVLYSLNNGKKVRPIIVTTIFKQITSQENVPDYVMQAALAIEYIHTASLIIDDIMDDDDYRRGKEALHIKYNLTLAQLGAILLFSLGMENIFGSLDKLNKAHPDTNKNIIVITGNLCSSLLRELTTGQYLDVDMPSDIADVGDIIKDENQRNSIKNRFNFFSV